MNSGMLWCLTPRIALTGVSIGFSSTQHCINHVPVQLGMIIWWDWNYGPNGGSKEIQQFTCNFLNFSWFHLCIVRSTLRIFPNSDIHLGIVPLKIDQVFFPNLEQVMLRDISVAINKRWPTSWRVLLTGPPKYIVPHPEDHYWFWVSKLCMHVDWGKLSNSVW